MKRKFFDALDETPFAIFLVVVAHISLIAGLLVIGMYVLNKTLDFEDIRNRRYRKNVN